MSKLRALRWLSFFCLITIIWPAGAKATSFEILNTPSFSYGDLDKDDLGLGANGIYYLGPIAAVNSFVYLENRYHDIYDHSLIPISKIDTALTLAQAAYMNTQLLYGTQVRDFYWGKYDYVEHQVAGKTIYAGETVPVEWTESRPRPAWVTERPAGPTWQFLYNELTKGADVELLLGVSGLGVYVTLTCFHFADADNDGIMDSSEAWIKYIDAKTGVEAQSNIWNSAGAIETNYGDGCFITMAASERPVPLPSTLLLFSSGILGLWGLRRKMKPIQG